MALKRIGILGGTFNPVHNGHLAIAEAVRQQFGLGKIIFLPTAIPPHKPDTDLISARDRMLMLHLALQGHPEYKVSDVELKRGGKSYTVVTMQQLQEIYGPGADIYLIIGADNLLEIAEWREIETLVQLCHFIIVTRPGFPLKKLEGENARWADKIIEKDKSNIIGLSVPVSSSEIRKRVRQGKDIRKLVPEKVLNYIQRKGLYRG